MSPRSHRPLRRGVGLVAVSALAASALAGLSSAPAQAAEPDLAPAAAGASWIAGELTDGLIFNPNFGGFTDYGLSVDTGLALDAVGDTTAVDTISAALAENVNSYITGVDFDSDDQYAGATAKAAAFAQAAGDDPTSYGGVDLVERLESLVLVDGPSAGRIQDVTTFNDSSNTIGQAFAAGALDGADSTLTDPATDFLLAQQCEEGFFRLAFSAVDAADQTCDGAAAPEADTDVTALALLQLQSQADDTTVQAAIAAGEQWLLETQAADGSWGGAGPTSAPNSNSTGLAGWVLGEGGETAAAEKAATYVRGLQADDPAPCTTELTATPGAIAYDFAAKGTARGNGITDDTADQWRRATAQSLPVLRWAPLTGSDRAVTPERFVRAGSRTTIAVGDQAPGDTVCFALRSAPRGLAIAGPGGLAKNNVRLPAGQGTFTYRATNGTADVDSVTVRALAATTLRVTTTKSHVAKRRPQRVLATGLAHGESVVVRYQGRVVDRGLAGRAGKFSGTFQVGSRAGAQSVRVVGEFGNRFGVRAFRVVPTR